MIRDVPETPRVINVIQERRRHAGVSRDRGTMTQIRRGNNNIGEEGMVAVGSGRRGFLLEVGDGRQLK
ncbi:hypothetical protein FF2_003083 [Malus domestica]